MNATPLGPCCPRISLRDIGYFSSTSDVTAIELLSYLEHEVGVNWADYFYCEFPCSLYPLQDAYRIMSELKAQGWTPHDLAHHHTYGYFVNSAGTHPALDKLGDWLDSLEDAKHWVKVWGATAAH